MLQSSCISVNSLNYKFCSSKVCIVLVRDHIINSIAKRCISCFYYNIRKIEHDRIFCICFRNFDWIRSCYCYSICCICNICLTLCHTETDLSSTHVFIYIRCTWTVSMNACQSYIFCSNRFCKLCQFPVLTVFPVSGWNSCPCWTIRAYFYSVLVYTTIVLSVCCSLSWQITKCIQYRFFFQFICKP